MQQDLTPKNCLEKKTLAKLINGQIEGYPFAKIEGKTPYL